MKFNPKDFWELTLVEADLIIKGDYERRENDFKLNMYANVNAIGMTLNGKKFKLIDPFEKKETEGGPKKKTREDLLAELESVKRRFNKE